MFDHLVAQVREAVTSLDVATLTGPQATAVVDVFAEIERLGAAGKALAASRAAETQQWRIGCDRSAAEWLARRTGTSVGTAKRTLDAAEKLGSAITSLTLEQAAVIATVPDHVEELSQVAATIPLQTLRERAARLRAATLPDRDADIHRHRAVRQWVDDTDVWHLHASGPKLDGAAFMARLQPFIDTEFERARADGRREPLEAYTFDALQAMSQSGGSSKPPVKVIVRADLTTLRDGGGGTCEIAGFGPISIDAARSLLGESALALVLTDGVDVVNVTRFGRHPTAHQQTALEWSQPTCRADGCTATARLERDHRIEWSVTKHTRYDELDRLCHTHHAMKTKGKQVRAP